MDRESSIGTIMAMQTNEIRRSHQAARPTILSPSARMCAIPLEPSTSCSPHILRPAESMDVGCSHLSHIRGLVEWGTCMGYSGLFHFLRSVVCCTHGKFILGCASRRHDSVGRRTFLGQDKHLDNERKSYGVPPPHQPC